MSAHVIPFEHLRNVDVPSVGGKNASLGEMISQLSAKGVRVPTGFATTADAYREFLAQGGLDKKINDFFRSAEKKKKITLFMRLERVITKDELKNDDNAYWHVDTYHNTHKAWIYLTDVKTIDNTEIKKLIGVKVLVVNALREEPHQTHFSLQDALDFIHLVQPERAYLTHISHLFGFHEEIQQKLPTNVLIGTYNCMERNLQIYSTVPTIV
jgi:hypothetical protein